jgi:pantothenate kinase type III
MRPNCSVVPHLGKILEVYVAEEAMQNRHGLGAQMYYRARTIEKPEQTGIDRRLDLLTSMHSFQVPGTFEPSAADLRTLW